MKCFYQVYQVGVIIWLKRYLRLLPHVAQIRQNVLHIKFHILVSIWSQVRTTIWHNLTSDYAKKSDCFHSRAKILFHNDLTNYNVNLYKYYRTQNMVQIWRQVSIIWLKTEVSFPHYGGIWSQILPILGTVPVSPDYGFTGSIARSVREHLY